MFVSCIEAKTPVAWSCTVWGADSSGKCEEVRTCTRSICDSRGKLNNCRTETKTECANPLPVAGDPKSILAQRKLKRLEGERGKVLAAPVTIREHRNRDQRTTSDNPLRLKSSEGNPTKEKSRKLKSKRENAKIREHREIKKSKQEID